MSSTLVRADRIQMLMPEFTENVGGDKDKALARELLNTTREVRVLLGQLFLYRAMSRSKEFADACDRSSAKEGAAIVVTTLLRTMVVSTAALFDDDSRASDIRRLLKAALRGERLEFIRRFHAHYGNSPAAMASEQRLVKYGRALRKRRLHDAITAVTRTRNTNIAHFDLQPNGLGRGAIIRDLDHVISSSAIIVGEANVFVLGRRVDGPELRKLLRKDANGFVSTLKRGFCDA